MSAATTTTDRPQLRSGVELYDFWSKIMVYLIFATVVLVMGFPLLWMLICSFKPPGELFASPPTLLPRQWTLDNYIDLFEETQFARYFVNSLIVGGGSTLLSLAIGCLGAYSMSRFDTPIVRYFARGTLLAYMLPDVLIVVPLYLFIVYIGLADTLLALIVANTTYTLPLALWFMRSYFAAIPVNLEESAMIDGCTRLQAFWRVVLPLAAPGIVSVGVFAFNSAWNEFLFALVFTSSDSNKVLPLGLATWIGTEYLYSWGMLLAAAVLITVPVMVFYVLVQRQLIGGLTDGGVKGS